MEHYALSLQCSPILSPLSYGSKRYENRKFHLRFKQTTLCFPQFTTSHSVTRSISHASCMNNSFSVPKSKNIERSDNILRGINGVSIVLGCVLGMFNFNSKMMNSKFNNAYASPQPLSTGASSFKSLWTSMNTNAKLIEAEIKLNSDHPTPDYMKKYALYIRKTRTEKDFDKEVEKMKNIYIKSIDESPPIIERSVRLSYMELLLIQGEFGKARVFLDKEIENIVSEGNFGNIENPPSKMMQVLNALKRSDNTKKSKKWDDTKKLDDVDKLLIRYREDDMVDHDKQSITDIIFYKAIIHIMLEDKEKEEETEEDKDKYKEADKWWGAFAETLNE